MGESGFKRSVKWFKKWLDEQGHDSAVRVGMSVLPVQISHRNDGEPVRCLVPTGGQPCEVERSARKRLGKWYVEDG